jgi:hypothetical protein
MIPYLKKRLSNFRGKTDWSNPRMGLTTKEGPAAVQEAIDYLEKMKAV